MSHHQKPVKPQPPKDKLFLTAGLYNDERSYAQLSRVTSKQPFVSQIDVVLDVSKDHAAIKAVTEAVAKYTFQHARLSLDKLLSPHFMTAYIRNGSLVALSCGDGSGDIAALDGNGRLILFLQKDTYSRLGIVGAASRFGQKRFRYFIEIDLREDCMRDGKPGYERIKAGLSKLGELDMMLTFVDANGEPERIALPEGSIGRTITPKIAVSSAILSSKNIEEDMRQLTESLSSKKRKSRKDNEQEDFATSILDAVGGLSGTETPSQPASRITISGLLHPKLVQVVRRQVESLAETRISALTAATFPHAPVSQAKKRSGTTTAKASGLDERHTDSSILEGWTLVSADQGAAKQYLLLESFA